MRLNVSVWKYGVETPITPDLRRCRRRFVWKDGFACLILSRAYHQQSDQEIKFLEIVRISKYKKAVRVKLQLTMIRNILVRKAFHRHNGMWVDNKYDGHIQSAKRLSLAAKNTSNWRSFLMIWQNA